MTKLFLFEVGLSRCQLRWICPVFLRWGLWRGFLMLAVFSSCAQEKQNINPLTMPVANTVAIDHDDTKDSIILKAAHIVPTKNQYEALKDEFIAFIHFGPNTFTRKEWGSGKEGPEVFNLQHLDTDQWCEAMVAAGIKKIILTVKHHDGFVLWQSRYTKHGIMSTPYKNGKGDVLKELSQSCEKYGLKLGIYLSPADLFQIENKKGLYGNLSEYTNRTIPRPVEGRPFKNNTTFNFSVDDYNEYFLNQLFELLTEYGPVHEVWFDGAHPKRKGGQKYNYLAWKELINTLAPKAVIFGKQDIRWCGNESGGTRKTEYNVVPYMNNPQKMNNFADITGDDIGSREKLYQARYLHYQPAETNTSIREGWFYRDDDKQRVRSADDVFDIYERSVGGNSIFLLNIPPNRQGKLSDKDVSVLEEVGKRIKETYKNNLFEGAAGPLNLLDGDLTTFEVLDSVKNKVTIITKEPVTINRLVLQEAVTTHGERVEKYILEAWVNDNWKEIAMGTNIGYKRILRFPQVTAQKFRIRISQFRYLPVIASITAHYYQSTPPQLEITRGIEGKVSIYPKKDDFSWKPHGENTLKNLSSGLEIRYTKDGSVPSPSSLLYEEPFLLESGEVKAVALAKGESGAVASRLFGIVKKDWKNIGEDSYAADCLPKLAFDENHQTFWQSAEKGGTHYLEIDLGKTYNIKGFVYSPQTEMADGMIETGKIKISHNGKDWELVESFKFGNLINNPTPRTHYFKSPVNTQFIRIESGQIAGERQAAAIAEIDFLLE